MAVTEHYLGSRADVVSLQYVFIGQLKVSRNEFVSYTSTGCWSRSYR